MDQDQEPSGDDERPGSRYKHEQGKSTDDECRTSSYEQGNAPEHRRKKAISESIEGSPRQRCAFAAPGTVLATDLDHINLVRRKSPAIRTRSWRGCTTPI